MLWDRASAALLVGAVLSEMTGSSLVAQNPAPQPSAPGAAARVVTLEDLRPSEEALFQEAVALQAEKNAGRAIAVYFDLLRFYPSSPHREEVLHRTAECYRALGRFDEAVQTLEILRKDAPKSRWLGAADLLQGEMLAADQKWQESVPFLERASKAEKKEVAVRAAYVAVLAREHLGQLKDAGPVLKVLLGETDPKVNPYLDAARLKSGIVAAQEKKNAEAAAFFKQVLSSGDPALRAEAAVRAGNLAYETGDYPEAAAHFEIVRLMDAPKFWKELAHWGLIQAGFARKDYAGVVDTYQKVKPAFPEASRAQVLYLTAESMRLSGKPKDSLTLYDLVAKDFSDSDWAEKALWARVLVLRTLESDDALPETARYLAQYPGGPHSFMVRLMRAEGLYDKNDLKNAVSMLAGLAEDPGFVKLGKPVQSGLWFKLGTGRFKLKAYGGAATAFQQSITLDPKSAFVPSALWLQGQAQIEDKKPSEALKTWKKLVESAPSFSEREKVLWKTGLLAVSEKDFTYAETVLGQFLKEFPLSDYRAEAWYWRALVRQESGNVEGSAEAWRKARESDGTRYFGLATQQLIRIGLEKRDLKALAEEVERYDAWRLKNPKTPEVQLDVYEWMAQELGSKQDPKLKESALGYYRRILAASKDREQVRRVQIQQALVFGDLENWGAARDAWKTFQAGFPEQASQNQVLLHLAEACLGAAFFDETTALAEQLLRQNPEGDYNAKARLLLGEVAFAKGRYAEAGKFFSAVAVLIDDPVITPQALRRAEEAYRRAGDEKQADQFLLERQKRFPN
jgi:tetratricopeptide (TPR) repeat protein